MFTPISLDKYIKLFLKSNPLEKEKEFRMRLEAALDAYKNDIKCSCGNDIWVAGSATAGYICFTCITGEAHPKGDYEIDSALDKIDKKGRRHIDEMDPSKIAGIFDDEGYQIDPDQIKKPYLCINCSKNIYPGPEDEMLCNLNRFDQKDTDNFICHSFEELPDLPF
jgi:DNA-directed RNA polymerase subunit RPC12/RpoP